MAGPAVVVVAGFVTAWLAIKSYDGLVEDNYYKVGLAVNQQLQQKHLAAQLGLKADLSYVEADDEVQLVLTGLQVAALPDDIRLKLVHPTRKGEDQIVVLHRTGIQFSGKFQNPPSVGRWNVVLEDPVAGWRMDTVWDLRANRRVTFAAKSQ